MVTLNCGTLFNLMTNVATKLLTGSSTMIYIFLMMALLLELVESLVMTAPPPPPDISLCGSNWSAKTSWKLAEPIGNSDHLPIIIKLNHKICYKPVIPRSARWLKNGVDWSSFTNEVESKISNLPREPKLSLRVSHFNGILISATTTQVGKSKPSKRSKPWMTPHV